MKDDPHAIGRRLMLEGDMDIAVALSDKIVGTMNRFVRRYPNSVTNATRYVAFAHVMATGLQAGGREASPEARELLLQGFAEMVEIIIERSIIRQRW